MSTDIDPQDAEERNIPRYAQVQRDLENKILEGDYALNSLLPPEIDLAIEYGTSRSTIREALRYLSERGYVERRQGVGTRIISAVTRSNYIQSFSSLNELFQVSAETYFVIMSISEITLDAEMALLIGGTTGEVWLEVEGIRWTEPGGKPISFVQSFVPIRYRQVVETFHTIKGPFFSELERHSDSLIEEVQQEIRAKPFPVNMVRALGLRPESWSLQLLRRYLTSSGVLIASFNWHPADQMTYVMRIQRRTKSDDAS